MEATAKGSIESQTGATSAATARVYQNAQAWSGPDMARRTDWIHDLSADEIREVELAVAAAIQVQANLVELDTDHFALPQFGKTLQSIRDEILHGRGFVLLRGMPVHRYSTLESAMAFRGIGAHLGEALSQNAKGHVLGHVKDLGLEIAAATTRGYQTTAELRFHTDGGDMVGLLCLKPPRSGGLSRIASSTTVWNKIAVRRPDLAAELQRPFYFSRWGEIGTGQTPWAELPLFTPWQGRMIATFIMSAIEKAQMLPGVPQLTDAQRESLELVNSLAGDDSIRLDMDFRPGDMQFLSNHAILHSRTHYEDWPEPEDRRHLLRLWLSSSSGPALPPYLTRSFQGATSSGRPDGIRLPGVALTAPLDAC